MIQPIAYRHDWLTAIDRQRLPRWATALPMNRLKTRAQFQAVLAAGTLVRTAHFAMHRLPVSAHALLPGDTQAPVAVADATGLPLFKAGQVWMGAMVPKRWARRAVTRNAIKRQIYAVSSRFESVLHPCAHVVRLRAAFDRKVFVSASSDRLKASVRSELLALFAHATAMKAPGADV